MKQTLRYLFFITQLFLLFPPSASASGEGRLAGRVVAGRTKEAVAFATVSLKGTSHAVQADARGAFRLSVPAGKYTLVVTAAGYKPSETLVRLSAERPVRVNVRLSPLHRDLKAAVVTAGSVKRVRESAYNVVALDARELHNSTLSLGDAIGRMPGMKLRETGGVGSDMQLMLDGFTGKHVRVFIDGVPQEGVGSAFGLNNIPVNFADRIEAYRGVVPVEFGADALGGVINIVTGKRRRGWWADASYAYGSFNTHRSYVNVGQNFLNGLTYELNAFQNYSDNSYHVDVQVKEYKDTDGDGQPDIAQYTRDEKRVRRFHDTYHNETLVGKIGVTGKEWADRLMLSLTYAHEYKDIQNGVRQEIVFGQKHRKGYTVMPAVEYYDRRFFAKGLDLRLTANYNHNVAQNVDTAACEYNWYGQRKYTGAPGEQSYQDSEQRNRNWNTTLTSNYRLGRKHRFTLSHVFSAFRRDTRAASGSTGRLTDYLLSS